MRVELEAIKFNHDPESATVDALTIRKNATESVSVPEWQRDISLNPEDSPAAYAICETRGHTVTIQAKFKCLDKSQPSIEVRALDERINLRSQSPCSLAGLATTLLRPLLRKLIGNVLGEVCQRRVALNDGESKFEAFDLKHVRLAAAGVGVQDMVWRWQYRLDRGSWTDFADTRHRVYVVLAIPTQPWRANSKDSSDTQLPWTEVLDHACQWATGAHTKDEATSLVTIHTYGLGGSRLKHSGGPSYIPPKSNNFDCTAFLDRLRGGKGNTENVNCADCATVVSSFSNILGCDLWQSQMGYNFDINPILRIGQSKPVNTDFLRHEVAWKGGCTEADPLFDAFLTVDGDSDPTGGDFVPLHPLNIRLGNPTSGLYHFRLAAHTPEGARCKADSGSRTRRVIGLHLVEERKTSPELLKVLIKKYDFDPWKEAMEESHLFIWKFFVSGLEVSDWKLERLLVPKTSGKMPAIIQSFWKSLGQSVLRVDIFECSSFARARSFLLEVLGDFETKGMKRRDHFPSKTEEENIIGDVLFVDPIEKTLLFARGNMVFLVRGCELPLDVAERFARQFDHLLNSTPHAVDGEKYAETSDFVFPDGNFHVGDEVELIAKGADSNSPASYKFVSSHGEVFSNRNKLTYRPRIAGLNEISIFGIESSQCFFRQRLTVNVR